MKIDGLVQAIGLDGLAKANAIRFTGANRLTVKAFIVRHGGIINDRIGGTIFGADDIYFSTSDVTRSIARLGDWVLATGGEVWTLSPKQFDQQYTTHSA